MMTRIGSIVSMSCVLALFAATGCSDQESKSSQSSFTLVGKWHSEQRDLSRLIDRIKAENASMPTPIFDPVIEKMKKGAQPTDDWEFKADGTGTYCLTGQEPFAITWKVVRKRGATWFLEVNMNPGDKSPAKIAFKGADKFSWVWLEEGESDEVPPETYKRVR
jgi:hypothetical protein